VTQQDFKLCFDKWFDEIRNYISYRSFDPELATDIVQETYMKLWEKNMEYRGSKTRSLLFKMASDLYVSNYRKQQTEKKHHNAFALTFDEHAVDVSVDDQELVNRMRRALAELPEKKRTVFLMNRMEGITYSNISKTLDISVKTVEKRMSQAIHTLRKLLKDES
jgi:RNA polymerase sigma factor (sigma-70 family)